ncbi:nucleotide sugar dehydrogenase [Actinacidiphila bryophytorum]|uniref:UDP-N-acetyl-D-glucosamine 6-dehydrogenase n=1 Tax=Actinacidiphila bryophytorum TaxID=1436133 RepID=A0A9W4GXH8_9ACTN|nr:nucleotide sugar dehydrogenase [Actinacidiphila bryophytorum]MBM9436387.1 nucleotide sugar dehydrogenase [Actinacidiphila bryophytorum]MBN6545310.1 nucleotide sugar dehydrogenase [Actinacidiphila bryophytorum]CAG7602174.1 UDP-N-acetyl-D-glucosamine 6-dehydrogenase [Actinacidiphila bryophytorum]
MHTDSSPVPGEGTARQGLVVVGLGYVGLPLAREASLAGLSVTGLDRDPDVAAALMAGRSHIDDISDAQVARMLAAGFRATADEEVLAGAGTVVICVPTPLTADGGPDLGAVRAASAAVSRHLRPGTLVVLESTSYPGTTEEVVLPILEESGLTAGRDFRLAFSPERVDPGNAVYGIRNTPKVVGGLTAACTGAAAAFYGAFVDKVVEAKGTREAEMAKLLENTYRHVNIALVNEMAVFCHELGIDLWDAIDCAATKPFGFQAFRPGPGVGGHCIPIDPNYLSYKVRTLGYPFRFVELAQEINARMPRYVVERALHLLNRAGKPLEGSRVLLLGVTYKADIADERESPARRVAAGLRQLGAQVRFHDPHVRHWTVDGTEVPRDEPESGAAQADLTVLLQAHAGYDLDAIEAAAGLLLDTRGKVRPRAGVEAL